MDKQLLLIYALTFIIHLIGTLGLFRVHLDLPVSISVQL